MKKKLYGLCLLLVNLVAFGTVMPLKQVVVFGDSLSDNGNYFALHQGQRPLAPYYFGRYSNGLVWAEILTNEMALSPDHLVDRAIAGAQTEGMTPPGLKAQVTEYINEYPRLNAHALYIIWSGGDNLLDNPTGSDQFVQEGLKDIHAAIDLLAEHGAEYFLVLNLPDVGLTPYVQALGKAQPKQHIPEHLTRLSKSFNKQLAVLLPRWQIESNVTIASLDIFALMQTLMADPASFGLNNTTDACYIGGEFTGGKGKVCATPDTYLFWDTIHPTQAVHQQIALYAMQALKDAGLQ